MLHSLGPHTSCLPSFVVLQVKPKGKIATVKDYFFNSSFQKC
jgi:hypothetical protein